MLKISTSCARLPCTLGPLVCLLVLDHRASACGLGALPPLHGFGKEGSGARWQSRSLKEAVFLRNIVIDDLVNNFIKKVSAYVFLICR